jgi:two-component system chemotaxis response regulator CheY
VTDYNMPEMDGRELSAYIREQNICTHHHGYQQHNESRLAAVQQAGVSAIMQVKKRSRKFNHLLDKMVLKCQLLATL